MKIAIVGGGSVGAWLACLLSRVKLDSGPLQTSLVVTSRHVAAVRSKGIDLIGWPWAKLDDQRCMDSLPQDMVSSGSIACVESKASETSALGHQDYVFLTVKAHQLLSTLPAIAPLVGPSTTVVSAQNGIPWWYFYEGPHSEPSGTHALGDLAGTQLKSLDPDGQLWEQLGPERAVHCVVYCAMELQEPGKVINRRPKPPPTAPPEVSKSAGWLVLGDPNAPTSPRVEKLQLILEAAGISTTINPNARAAVWSKLMGNAFFNPVTALTGLSWGEVGASDVARDLGKQVVSEIVLVAKALGVDIGDGDVEARYRRYASERTPFKSSMLQDAEQGRQLEVAAILSAPIEIAEKLGISTPACKMLEVLLKLKSQALLAGNK